MGKPVVLRDKFDAVYLEMEFEIAAPKERVWKILVEETHQWWPVDFTVGPAVKRVVLEPRLGGRLYEEWGDGNGLTWFTVEALDAPNMIELMGRLSKDFGGPAKQLVELRLESVGKYTVLRLSDTVFGAIDKSLEKSLREGWTLLFGQALKNHAESAAP